MVWRTALFKKDMCPEVGKGNYFIFSDEQNNAVI